MKYKFVTEPIPRLFEVLVSKIHKEGVDMIINDKNSYCIVLRDSRRNMKRHTSSLTCENQMVFIEGENMQRDQRHVLWSDTKEYTHW